MGDSSRRFSDKNRESLNNTDMCIWRLIANHRKQAGKMSVQEMAKACAVSSATLVRFAKKLGFSGFGELKAAINFERPLPPDYKDDVIKSLKNFYDKTVENLTNRDYEGAIKLLYNARRLKIKGVPSLSITRLSENTLASLSTVNLYISPASFQISDDVQYKTLMPFFMIVEILYLKYRIFLQQQE